MNPVNPTENHNGAPSSILAELVDRLTARVQAGEPIDWQEVARQHPDHVGALRQLWPALGALEELSQSEPEDLSGIAPAAAQDGWVGGVLGDFRILREVGRGGMGVVYQAEQISLRRQVALKVLPLSGILDQRRLRRFHNEAQAAASLHHTNIVPVFAVGSERGVHFYAMQFIDGHTLAETIRQARQAGDAALGPVAAVGDVGVAERTTPYQAAPGGEGGMATTEVVAKQSTLTSVHGKRDGGYYRRVAELGVQAAEALDHAHQMGIVHRDVKPANLMVDGRGNLWVADFGLAHLQHAEGSLTMTGEMVGTLRYMSPEQALAKRVPIDHRTDVYSLGATLYELLTLRPAFAGSDRQELLRQVAFEEPAAPRKLDRGIPAELETIVLKALEKNPADRYATAQNLADDMRRFLEDQPIRARRPSWRQVATKWVRRHRTVVTTVASAIAVMVLLGAVALATSNAQISAAYQSESEQRGKAEAAAREERRQRGIAEEATGKEKHHRRIAEEERNLAMRRLYIAHMLLAGQAWDVGQLDRVEELLERHVPKPGQPDLRGWEWHYLQALSHRELLSVGGRYNGFKYHVLHAALSPDGDHLATAHITGKNGSTGYSRGDPSAIKVWDVNSRKEVRTLVANGNHVSDLGWSSDGKRLASTQVDGTIRVWDGRTWQETMTFKGPAQEIGSSVSWSPDNRHLASLARPGYPSNHYKIKVWDTAAGKEVHSWEVASGGHMSVMKMRWSPNGCQLAAMIEDSVLVWETTTGQQLATIPLRTWHRVSPAESATTSGSMSWSPDSKLLALAGGFTATGGKDETVRLWDSRTRQVTAPLRPHPGGTAWLAWSPSGLLATTGADQQIKIWDAKGWRLRLSINVSASWLEWSPDGQRLTCTAERLKVLDAVKGTELFSLPVCCFPADMGWSRDGHRLLSSSVDFAGPYGYAVQVWNAAHSMEAITSSGHREHVNIVAWHPTGRYLASASDDKTVRVWDPTTGKAVLTLRGHHNPVRAIAWSPDGRHLASASVKRDAAHGPGKLIIWDTMTGDRALTLPWNNFTSLAYTPDGKYLVLPAPDGGVSFRDPATGKEVRTIKDGTRYPPDCFVMSRDGKRLATAGHTVHVWDVNTGKSLFSVASVVHGLAFSSDGKYLAGIPRNRGKTVQVWDVMTGREVLTLRGHPALVASVAWSPDGKRLACSSDAIRIWDFSTGEEVLSLRGQAPYAILAFSPDGRCLASAHRGGTVRLWDAAARSPRRHPEPHPATQRPAFSVLLQGLRDLATDILNDPDLHLDTAAAMNEQGRRLASLGQGDQAAAAYREALAIQEKLSASLPNDSNFFLPLAVGYCNFGHFEQGRGRLDACLPWYGRAIQTLQAQAVPFRPKAVPFRHSAQRNLFLFNAWVGKAQALRRLNRHAEALKDWDQCLPLSGEPNRTLIRFFRAVTLARLGQHAQAIAEADELAGSARATADVLYNSACVYALSAAAIPKKDSLGDRYATRAVELLGQAVKKGYRDAAHIKGDKDLDVLRSRPDFKKLLAGIVEQDQARLPK